MARGTPRPVSSAARAGEAGDGGKDLRLVSAPTPGGRRGVATRTARSQHAAPAMMCGCPWGTILLISYALRPARIRKAPCTGLLLEGGCLRMHVPSTGCLGLLEGRCSDARSLMRPGLPRSRFGGVHLVRDASSTECCHVCAARGSFCSAGPRPSSVAPGPALRGLARYLRYESGGCLCPRRRWMRWGLHAKSGRVGLYVQALRNTALLDVALELGCRSRARQVFAGQEGPRLMRGGVWRVGR
jgi:hypothetical protein